MIGPLDAITLARTKIHSKRLRLLITTVVSALVFGVMAGPPFCSTEWPRA